MTPKAQCPTGHHSRVNTGPYGPLVILSGVRFRDASALIPLVFFFLYSLFARTAAIGGFLFYTGMGHGNGTINKNAAMALMLTGSAFGNLYCIGVFRAFLLFGGSIAPDLRRYLIPLYAGGGRECNSPAARTKSPMRNRSAIRRLHHWPSARRDRCG